MVIHNSTHLPWTKWPLFWQRTLSIAFSWMKKIEFRFKLHWNMFPGIQLTISQHGFRRWLGAEQATSHYLDQWSPSLLTHICGTRGRWDKRMSTEITLKQKCRHFDEIFITGCTESCQNDNFRCSQWLKFHQNDNISVSVNGSAILVHIGFGNDSLTTANHYPNQKRSKWIYLMEWFVDVRP